MTELQSLFGVKLGDLLHVGGTKFQRGDKLIGYLGIAFRNFCRNKKIEKPPATWNLHLIGRGSNDDANSYPVLDSNVKAAHTKPMLFFVAELAREIYSHCKCYSD